MFMTTRSKRLIMVLMFTAIALSLFTQVPVNAQSKPKGEITVWTWKGTWDGIRASKVLDDFSKEYPDIKLNQVEIAAADVYQKLPLALSAGTGAPDVSLVEDSALSRFVQLGGLADLTDRVKPYLDKIVPYKWTTTMKDGKYYAMPWDIGPVVFYYRRDVFKQAGLSDDPAEVEKMVATWDDLLKTCQTIKDKTGKLCFPLNKANNNARMYEKALWQQGLGYVNDKGEVTVDSAENIATLEKFGEFWKANLLSDQQEWTDGWYADFSGKDKSVAGIVMAAWYGGFLKVWMAPDTKGLWGVTLMPAMKAGQVRAANDGGSTFIIPEQSKNKEAAWAYIEFMLGRVPSQVKMLTAADLFPSLIPSFEDKAFSEPDPFFGGQTTRKLYVDVALKIPKAMVYGPNYDEINRFVSTAIQKYATGAASAKDALKEAADAIRQQTGLK